MSDRRVAAPRRGVLEELFDAAALGDIFAFAELYDRTVGFVHGVLRRARPDGALDATEQVYLRLWQIAPDYAANTRAANGSSRSVYCAILTALHAELGAVRPL